MEHLHSQHTTQSSKARRHQKQRLLRYAPLPLTGTTLVASHQCKGDYVHNHYDPFGTIKHYDDGRYFLCKGKEKVTAEFALSALVYNIRRAINICGGVHNLIDRYRRIAMPKIRKIAEI